jgi:DNA-binding IclR family transcriptional regulator
MALGHFACQARQHCMPTGDLDIVKAVGQRAGDDPIHLHGIFEVCFLLRCSSLAAPRRRPSTPLHCRSITIDGERRVHAHIARRQSRILGALPGKGRNSTADRAIDVLLLFDDQGPVLSALDVSERLAMPRSTTYRYLQSLRSYGLVEDDSSSGGFRLGPRVLQLARMARKGLALPEVALPCMRELAELTGEAVLLTRRSERQVVCVERVESRHRIRLTYERGTVLAPHAGASAKVLLAWLPEHELDELLRRAELTRYTERTVIEPAALRAELATIRQAGYAISYGEVDPGVRGIAAPIFGSEGQVVAGLSTVGPAFRLDDAALPGVVEATRRSAEGISARMAELEG